jgi:hypothetical protein
MGDLHNKWARVQDRRYLAMVLIIFIAALSLVAKGFSNFTTKGTEGAVFSTGKITLKDNLDGVGTLFNDASDLKPGETRTRCYTLYNMGSLPVEASISMKMIGSESLKDAVLVSYQPGSGNQVDCSDFQSDKNMQNLDNIVASQNIWSGALPPDGSSAVKVKLKAEGKDQNLAGQAINIQIDSRGTAGKGTNK